jgi:hypothetical protein
MPCDGKVSKGGTSYYRITGLASEEIYTITLTLTDGLPYQTVPNAVGGGSVACGWNNTVFGATIDCSTRATAGGVLDFRAIGDDTVGGAYVISLAEGGVVNEGSPSDPVVVSSFPFSGGALIHSFYLLTGLIPGGAYAIEFTDASSPVALFIFPDDRYQGSICSSRNDSGNSCNVTADGSGQIYLKANAQEVYGVTYTISVTVAGLANEGWQNEPIDISDQLPYSGMVHKGSSWYIINGLTAGSSYTITLSNATDNVALRVYGAGWVAAGGPHSDCYYNWANGGGNPIACVSTADSNGEIRIKVQGINTTDGATFDLDNAAGGIPNEGYPDAPVDLTGNTPWSGTIYNGPSYYKITGRAAGTDHTVTISNLTGDLTLWVYDDGAFQNQLCWSSQLGTVDETCVVQTTTGELHTRVTASFYVLGATFSLDVAP